MGNLDFVFTPAFVAVGIKLFLLAIRSLRLLIYDFRVSRRGGIHAPRIPNDIVSGISRCLPACMDITMLIATSDSAHFQIRQSAERKPAARAVQFQHL
jgi:hypothetical protein